jgi:CO/xanthine dehydrogenase FAD-binding subunit
VRTRLRDYHRPGDVVTASQLLNRADVSTAVLRIGPRPLTDPHLHLVSVVDLSHLGLAYVSSAPDERIVIGGSTALSDIASAPQLFSLANGLVCEAAHLAAHAGLRNVADLGGALASPDGPPELLLALLALDAHVALQGTVRRNLPLAAFVANPSEILIEVSFRAHTQARGALSRVARSPRDQAIVAAAAVVGPRFARVAVAGASPTPIICQADAGGRPSGQR